MPITELVFPLYKQDSQSLELLKSKESEIFQHLSGVDGLRASFLGRILEENQSAVDPSTMRSVLVLDWDKLSSFQAFYPNSDRFKGFIGAVKPFVAAPATPELYESEERSISCTSAKVLQIFKAPYRTEIEEAWARLKDTVKTSTADKPKFYHANGVEKDQGSFLGLVGWTSFQEYEQFGKNDSLLMFERAANEAGRFDNIVVELTPLN